MVTLALMLATAFVPVLAPGDAVPGIPLVDQRGRAFTIERFRGRTLIVGFVYTRCRDARECPLVSAKLARVQQAIGSAPIGILELTVDPAHDDPATLARYAQLFGADAARWSLATGKPGDVLALERRLGVDVAPGKGGDVVHTEALVFVGPDGRIADRLGGSEWTSAEVLARAQTIAGLSASPLERVRLALSRGIDAVCGGGVSGISLGVALVVFAVSLGLIGFAASRALLANPARERTSRRSSCGSSPNPARRRAGGRRARRGGGSRRRPSSSGAARP